MYIYAIFIVYMYKEEEKVIFLMICSQNIADQTHHK